MAKKNSRSIPLRRPIAVPVKRLGSKLSKAKGAWLMKFLGVMPDLGDPVAIQRELRRERR